MTLTLSSSSCSSGDVPRCSQATRQRCAYLESQTVSRSVISMYVFACRPHLSPNPSPDPNHGAPYPHPTLTPTAPLFLALPVAGTGGDA